MVDAAPPWSKGGRERRYAELVRRVANDLDVTIYTMRWWDERPSGPTRYVAISPKIPLYRRGRRSILHGLLFALATLQLLFRGFDVLYADHMPYLQLFPLRLVAWLRRVPFVVEWHECWSREYWRAYLGTMGTVASAIEHLSLRLPDLIVPDSDVLAGQLRELGVDERRLVVVTNAVDRAGLAEVAPDPDAPTVLFVGRLIDHKRADVALKALAAMRARPRPPTLALIGEGPDRDALVALARELGVDERVRFLGTVERDADVAALIRGARVLVSPSEREGFGLTVAEALALGTPVVTVDCHENNAAALVDPGTTGTVVTCGDAGDAARAIDGWLDRDDPRDGVRTSFWARHEELDWARSARRFVELMEQVATR